MSLVIVIMTILESFHIIFHSRIILLLFILQLFNGFVYLYLDVFFYTLSMLFFKNLLGLRVLMVFNLFIYLLCSHLVFNILLLFISISNLIKNILNIISMVNKVKEEGSY
jgi:hypothetical protein